MKTIFRKAAYIILALAAASCAKAVVEGTNIAEKRYFDAWLQNNYPNVKPTGLGIYHLWLGAGSVRRGADPESFYHYQGRGKYPEAGDHRNR